MRNIGWSIARCVAAVGLVGSLASCTPRALEIPQDFSLSDFTGVDLVDLTRFDLDMNDLADLGPRDLTTPPVNHCPAGTQFIFTIDQNATLSRFNPVSAEFFDVGTINCPINTPGDMPNSMAIDQTGNGIVNFGSGDMFRLFTDTGACEATAYQPGQFGITRVGMSFAQNTPNSTDETLFITPTTMTTASLASVNLTTFVVSNPINLPTGQDGELTGDDQANLFGFFPSAATPFIARINKTKGTFDRQLNLTSLSGNPSAWGFAAWQTDFYVFLQRDVDASTNIYHIDGKSGAVTTAVSNTGRVIVGVGVATCAEPASD